MFNGKDLDTYLRLAISKAADGTAVLLLKPVSVVDDQLTDEPSRSMRNVFETLFTKVAGREAYALQIDGSLIGGGGGGTTFHGDLTGLDQDDHLQYLTNARGDDRYYLKAAVNSLIALKARTYFTLSNGTISILPGSPASPPVTPYVNDTIIERYDNCLIFWEYESGTPDAWNIKFTYFFPKTPSNRTITVNDVMETTDDMVMVDPSANTVEYLLHPNPSDNDEVTVMATNLDNQASISRNGKLINEAAQNVVILAAWEPYTFRYIQSLNSWVLK